MNWKQLPYGERAIIQHFELDVWPIYNGARYSVLDLETGRYIAGGQCLDLEWAKQVSAGFAESLINL